MSSNSDKELKRSQRLKENAKKSADANKKKIKKFRNEKLYRRINLSFSVLNVSVTAIAVLIMLLVCIFSMRNFQKNSLTDFSRKLYDQVMAQSSHILAHDENDRVDHIFEECILPLGDMKLEVGIAVGDSYNKRADTYSFDSFYTSARETFEIEYTDFGSGEVNAPYAANRTGRRHLKGKHWTQLSNRRHSIRCRQSRADTAIPAWTW